MSVDVDIISLPNTQSYLGTQSHSGPLGFTCLYQRIILYWISLFFFLHPLIIFQNYTVCIVMFLC